MPGAAPTYLERTQWSKRVQWVPPGLPAHSNGSKLGPAAGSGTATLAGSLPSPTFEGVSQGSLQTVQLCIQGQPAALQRCRGRRRFQLSLGGLAGRSLQSKPVAHCCDGRFKIRTNTESVESVVASCLPGFSDMMPCRCGSRPSGFPDHEFKFHIVYVRVWWWGGRARAAGGRTLVGPALQA